MPPRAKNIPVPAVHKVTFAEATRDVIVFVLGKGKTWQFLVIMLAWWATRNATMDDARLAAHYLLNNSVFGWGGWALSILVMILSSFYIGRAARAANRRIRELTAINKELTERDGKLVKSGSR